MSFSVAHGMFFAKVMPVVASCLQCVYVLHSMSFATDNMTSVVVAHLPSPWCACVCVCVKSCVMCVCVRACVRACVCVREGERADLQVGPKEKVESRFLSVGLKFRAKHKNSTVPTTRP